MKVRRILVAMIACGLISSVLSAGVAQAKKPSPKPKNYTYCVSNGKESECFKEPIEVFRKTHTWAFETTTGTYTVAGKSYDFRETNGPAELIGTKGKHGVIAGTLYENGKPTEFTFTLTPR
jgi:hypothetical protein